MSEQKIADESSTRRPRRRGRLARHEYQPAEPAVWPGVNEGCYRPLSERDMERVHATVLDLLDKVGLASAIPSTVERVTSVGGGSRSACRESRCDPVTGRDCNWGFG